MTTIPDIVSNAKATITAVPGTASAVGTFASRT